MILNDFINKIIKAKDRWAYWYEEYDARYDYKERYKYFLENGGFELIDNSTTGNVRIKIPANVDKVLVEYRDGAGFMNIEGVAVNGDIIGRINNQGSNSKKNHKNHKMFIFTNIGGGYISINHEPQYSNNMVYIRGL